MRRIIIVLVLSLCVQPHLLAYAAAPDPSTDPAAIQAEIRKIRKRTDWSNEQAVTKSNDQIKNLLRQLEKGRLQQEAAKGMERGEAPPDQEDQPVVNRASVREQVQKTAAEGRGAALNLTGELRKKIVEEYKEERKPEISNPAFFAEMTTLVINIETPQGQATIKQLDKFISVRRLIISGGKSGGPINLEDVFRMAAKLPLEELHIINFRAFVVAIPESLAAFKALSKLALYNNAIQNLPASISSLTALKALYVDVNPLSSVLPVVEKLPELKTLGLAKTKVSGAEISSIRKSLPQCKVITE
jgi:hypothetical protein